MSLVGMDLGPKMDWALDNGLYQRFKVFKESCIDIPSGPLHATPEENQVHYLHYWTGEEGSKFISQWTAEGKITNDGTEATSKKKLRTYWQLFKDYTKLRLNSLIVVLELKWLFQGSMTLEQFVKKQHFWLMKPDILLDTKTGWCVTLSSLVFPMTQCMGRLSRKAPTSLLLRF